MNTMTKYSFFLLLILGLAACNKPGDSLETSEAQTALAGAGDTLNVDPTTLPFPGLDTSPLENMLEKYQ